MKSIPHKCPIADPPTAGPHSGGAHAQSPDLPRNVSLFAHAQMPQYALSRFPAFEHRRDHQIRAAHHVAARKDFWIGRLESGLRSAGYANPAIGMQIDFLRLKPIGGTR